MLKTCRRFIPCLLGAAILTIIPTRGLAQACGPFTDVLASDLFCPFILEAFNNGITSGTSTTTFSPNLAVPRNQMVVFVDRGVDTTLRRGAVRTAIGKTWLPTSPNGGIGTDVAGGVRDMVTDGTFLWIARSDGKILKVNAADRRLQEMWTPQANLPKKLGIFGGQVWAVDDQGGLQFFNPTLPAGTTTLVGPTGIPPGNFPALAFDGTNLWLGNSGSPNLALVSPTTLVSTVTTLAANIDGLVWDGANMWVLLANATILKMAATANGTATTVETLALTGPVSDCRMVFDGSNIWIPSGGGVTAFVQVVHPTTSSPSVLPSSVVYVNGVPNVSFPYVASFDGENVMIGGVSNGVAAVYKATTFALLGTFNTGAAGIRGIASDGKSFNVGDSTGTKFFQF